MAPAAPNPPEVPPTKRPSPSSSTGSSELQRAQEAHHETVDGWDPEPAGSADSAMEQSDPQHPGRATQSDRPATLQASQPPENAWEPRQGTHNAAASAQHPQQMSEQQPEAYRPDIAERQLGHSQQDTDGSAHLETQQRVKAYRRVQGQQQVKPYRPDGAVYRPPPSSSHQPTAATSSAAENSAADASWGDEEDRPLAADTADPQSQELADAAGKIAAGLGDMIDDLPQANSHAATQQAGKEPADEDLSGHQGSMQVGAAEEQHREEEEGMQQGEDEDRGRGKAGAPAGPSDAHRHRHDEEDGVADRDVHMMGTTPPGTSGIQPAAAAISQLTASQQVGLSRCHQPTFGWQQPSNPCLLVALHIHLSDLPSASASLQAVASCKFIL